MSEPMPSYARTDECAGWGAEMMLQVVRGHGSWLRRRMRRRIVVHLLSGCEACSGKIRILTVGSKNDERDSQGDSSTWPEGLFLRSIARLEEMQRPAQELYIRGVEGLRTRAFVEWLVGEARRCLTRDPERAVRLGRLAVLTAQGQDRETEAFAAMYMGHVWSRSRSDFQGADTWFDQAQGLMSREEFSAQLRAKLMRMQGLSRYSQSRSEEALEKFEEAARIYQVEGDTDGLGQTYVDSAGAVGESVGSKEAIGRLFAACGLIDFSANPRYALAISQNLSLHYANLGDTKRALTFLDLAKSLLEEQGAAPADSLKIDWSGGRILASAGSSDESVPVFRRAREGFVRLGLAAEAGQVSLDLALSLLTLGRVQELREVAEEMLPIFRSRLLHKEALAAVEFFREAVFAETITAAQIHAVADFLSDLESNSRARFRRPG